MGSYVRKRKAVKASRASLEGIAGHQTTMKYLAKASKNIDSNAKGDWIPRPPYKSPMPGIGHVNTGNGFDMGAEGLTDHVGNKQRKEAFANYTKHINSKVESNVIGRHKPTKDF